MILMYEILKKKNKKRRRKYDVVYTHKRILFSHKEPNYPTYRSMSEYIIYLYEHVLMKPRTLYNKYIAISIFIKIAKKYNL